MSDELHTMVRNYLVNHFPAFRETGLTDATPLLETGAIDSLGLLALAQFITAEIGIELSDDDFKREHFENLPALVAFLETKRK